MITLNNLNIEDLTISQEHDLFTHFLGFIPKIPHYQYPINIIILTNKFLNIKYITIFCKKNAKTQIGERETYDYKFKL